MKRAVYTITASAGYSDFDRLYEIPAVMFLSNKAKFEGLELSNRDTEELAFKELGAVPVVEGVCLSVSYPYEDSERGLVFTIRAAARKKVQP